MTQVSFDQITSARVRRFDAYWRGKWIEGRMPGRAAIDPTELRDLLPCLIIADIERSPFRVRYRLSGTLVQHYSEELAGRYLDELTRATGEEKAEIGAAYRRAVEQAAPQFGVHDFVARTTDFKVAVQAGIWPLLGTGGVIEQCVAVEDYIGL